MRGKIKHGLYKTRIYRIWKNIKTRCLYKTHRSYKDYGGRGIKICKDWEKDFVNFYKWSCLNGYSDNLSIDRIDVNGNYCPENCRWSTKKEQQRNTRKNRIVSMNGVSKCLSAWSEDIGIKYTTIKYRLEHGWSVEDALTKKVALTEIPEESGVG